MSTSQGFWGIHVMCVAVVSCKPDDVKEKDTVPVCAASRGMAILMRECSWCVACTAALFWRRDSGVGLLVGEEKV